MAWVSCLLLALAPIGYVTWLVVERNSFDVAGAALFMALPAVLALRFTIVGLQLGRDLANHGFLMRMETWAFAFLYLGARFIGLARGGAGHMDSEE